MVLATTSVLMVTAVGTCVSRVSPRRLLPFWDALQDQKVGLTQAPSLLLPLLWDLVAPVRFSVCPLGQHFCVLQPSSLPVWKLCWSSQPAILGAHLFSAGPLGGGA